jgi:HlyD family secretion protein
MLRLLRNRRVWLGVAIVASLVAVAMWPRAVTVEVAPAVSGPMVVTIDEDGRTRVRDRFVVTAPVGGELLRIGLRPGDRVERGATLAVIRPAAPVPLDARTRTEAEAAVRAAEAAIGRLGAEEARVKTAADQARRDVQRAQTLATGGAVAREEVERLQTVAAEAAEAVRASEFALSQARHELAVAQARLMPAGGGSSGRDWTLTAPVTGVVLARHRESQSVVPPGDPLLEIGDPSGLEVVADLLSADAVKIRAGQRVIIDDWGGPTPLAGSVRRVEPAGFTKISALGVEEQRVNVVIDLDTAAETTALSLGDNYRVEVRIVVWEAASTLTVSPASLFRQGDAWAVYVVEDGLARVRRVEVAERNARQVRIVSGVVAGELVVSYPPDTLADGVRVVTREGT